MDYLLQMEVRSQAPWPPKLMVDDVGDRFLDGNDVGDAHTQSSHFPQSKILSQSLTCNIRHDSSFFINYRKFLRSAYVSH
jgi:hypothetical protein